MIVLKQAREYLDTLWDNLEESKRKFNEWSARHNTYKEELDAKIIASEKATKDIVLKEQSITSMKEISKYYETHTIRREIENILESVISQLYHEESKYKFIKKYIKKQHEVYIYKVERDDNNVEHYIPINNTSGGNRDIIDIIIRILIIKQFPENQRVLILDEPMKDLSKDLREPFFKFLKSIAESFSIQLIMVSHEDEYIGNVDNKIKFVKIGNESKIVKEENK